MLASAVTIAVGFVATALLTALYQRWAMQRSIVDSPGHRSSHEVDTVHGAGAVFVVVYALMAIDMIRSGSPPLPWYFLAPAFVGAIGLVDDFYSLGVRIRMLGYAVVIAVVVLLASDVLNEQTGLSITEGVYLGLWLFAGLWFVNLYNFMDGINGIAGVQALFLIGASLFLASDPALQPLLLLTLGAIGGFLVWNFPVARVFMGDAGSTMLGSLFICLALYYHSTGSLELAALALLPAVFVADATIHLLRRMATGQNWTEAHRSHAYQRLARRWGSHTPVVLLVLAINLCWIAPLAWAAQNWPAHGAIAVGAAYLPLLLSVFLLGAGCADSESGG